MNLNLPTWSLSPALMLFTLLYFIPPHMNYTWTEWIYGNSLVGFGICVFYIQDSIFKKNKYNNIIK